MVKQKFREVLEERIRIENETQGSWEYGIEECWDNEVKVLAENVYETVEFMKNECSADDFTWMSEIIEELIERTQSREIMDEFYNLVEKYPKIDSMYNIQYIADQAAKLLKNR